MRFPQQDTLSEAVKCRYAQTFGCLAVEQTVDALAHFACSLVGEGDGAYMLRGMTFLNEPGDFPGNNAGLAAAGSGQYQAGRIDTGDGLLLWRVEIFQVQGCKPKIPS